MGNQLSPDEIYLRVMSDLLHGVQEKQDMSGLSQDERDLFVNELVNSLAHTNRGVRDMTNYMKVYPAFNRNVQDAYGEIVLGGPGSGLGRWNAQDRYGVVGMPWSVNATGLNYKNQAGTTAHEFGIHPTQKTRGPLSAIWNWSSVEPHGIYDKELIKKDLQARFPNMPNQWYLPEEAEARALEALMVKGVYPETQVENPPWPKEYDPRYKILFEELMLGRR